MLERASNPGLTVLVDHPDPALAEALVTALVRTGFAARRAGAGEPPGHPVEPPLAVLVLGAPAGGERPPARAPAANGLDSDVDAWLEAWIVAPGDHAARRRAAELGLLGAVQFPGSDEALAADVACALARARERLAFARGAGEIARLRSGAGAAAPAALADRRAFLELAESTIARARAQGSELALVLLEPRVRGDSGEPGERDEPDELAVEVLAQRLRQSLREGDLLARLGPRAADLTLARTDRAGFALLLESTRAHEAARVARRLIETAARPLIAGERELRLVSTAGIALFPADAARAEELLAAAHEAACHARRSAVDVEFHSAALNAPAFERIALEGELALALERGQITVHYQPRVEIASGRIVGLEALVRWKHPTRGLVSPAQFIPLAEETGLIVPLGHIVLREACTQARRWQQRGLPPVHMAVNLSGAQFRDPALYATIVGVLAESGLAPRWLELELTESLLMQDAAEAVQILRRLKSDSIRLAIDDFGTGYSSLAYLKHFPIDALKIDQSFVREINTDPDDAAIATSIILMGRSLKLRVIAEGVETKSQLAFLRVMQCDEAQGYLFSRPLPADELEPLLARPDMRLAA
jgi:EAL domain-containing protein (putative c-di-GMP-specific phosphodiesterase class I)/GGDEF domain-containing protein